LRIFLGIFLRVAMGLVGLGIVEWGLGQEGGMWG
jgi:hypothetical protein